MIPPQWGIETIGARPRTLPVLLISVIFSSVLNSLKPLEEPARRIVERLPPGELAQLVADWFDAETAI